MTQEVTGVASSENCVSHFQVQWETSCMTLTFRCLPCLEWICSASLEDYRSSLSNYIKPGVN